MSATRGLGGLGGHKRRPPFTTLKQLYGANPAFSGLCDMALLGSITLIFLDPHAFKAPFEWFSRPAAHVVDIGTPAAANPTPATPSPSPTAAPAPAPRPGKPPATVNSAGTSNVSAKDAPVVPKAVPFATTPLVAAPTPGLTDTNIVFSAGISDTRRPSLNALLIDERSFATLPADTQAAVRTAMAARSDGRGADMLAALEKADASSGAVQFLLGVATLLKSSTAAKEAQGHFSTALAAGHAQAATFLGQLLVTGARDVASNAPDGNALLKNAVAAGERSAIFLAGLALLNGDAGAVDPARAAELVRSAAEQGEPLALLHFARLAQDGVGMPRDRGLAETALRRAADAGLTDAEATLGRWIVAAYTSRKIDDPSEGVALLQRARRKGDLGALSSLGLLYNSSGLAPPWKDVTKGFDLLSECAAFRMSPCHNNLGSALQSGRGVVRDVVAAWAHYDIGRQLNTSFVMPQMSGLDATLLPDEKTRAQKMSQDLMTGLSPSPTYVVLRRDR